MSTLRIDYTDGTTETIEIRTGQQKEARRMPSRIGKASVSGRVRSATLVRSNGAEEPRVIIKRGASFYTRRPATN